MKLCVTTFEMTRIDLDHDGIEVRAEKMQSLDLRALRASTNKPIILTRRGVATTEVMVREAIDAGIDFVDVEYRDDLGWIEPYRSCIVLSHHDYQGMQDFAGLLRAMRSFGCVHTKLAVTPRNLAGNLELLRHAGPGVTVIGMGERGLYSRILAPFVGSELAFVSVSEERSAAPGQITLESALKIYGEDREHLRAECVFAVVGNPAGHSLSPLIHNPLFREKGVSAAYTIASVERFDEVVEPFLRGEIAGLSVTTPFKEEALAFAERVHATVGENADAARAVNTLVNIDGRILADNSDVDGFSRILARLCGRDRKSVAVVGAGATARAACVSLERAGMHTTVFHRGDRAGRPITAGGTPAPLSELPRFDGEIVIDTTGAADLDIPFRAGMSYIRAAYAAPGPEARAREAGVEVCDGLDLLRAQAEMQHDLFMRVFGR